MTQYGFFFDQSRVTVAGLFGGLQELAPAAPGPLKYLKVFEYEKGSFRQCVSFPVVPAIIAKNLLV